MNYFLATTKHSMLLTNIGNQKSQIVKYLYLDRIIFYDLILPPSL